MSNTCSIWFELIKGIPAAFVALVIGVIAAGIAFVTWCIPADMSLRGIRAL